MNIFYQTKVVDYARHGQIIVKNYRWFHSEDEFVRWAESAADALRSLMEATGLVYGLVTTRVVGKRLELLDKSTEKDMEGE